MIIWFILAGIVSGVIAGMGMGGGTLLIPILTILLSFAQKTAQCINLIAFIPMAIVALIIHIKNKLVDFKLGIFLIITGVVGAVGGALMATIVKNFILQKIFAVFLIIIAITQIWSIVNILIMNTKKKHADIVLNYYSTNIYQIGDNFKK